MLTLLLFAIAAATPSTHQVLKHAESDYQVVTVDLRQQRLDLVGQALGTPHTFAALGEQQAATNAGIFHTPNEPVGLWIEDGVVLQPIELDAGDGNFFLKPNGVFWVDGSGAHVSTSDTFAMDRDVRIATQSGPMLLVDGEIHPSFQAHSTSLRVRSGVGVSDPWTVHLVVSQEPVRFWDLATLFRDRLNADNALFLDGTISQMVDSNHKSVDQTVEYAGFITVTSRATASGIEEGDVVFHRSRSSQSEAIALATGSRLTHTGIVRMIDGEPWVLEAVQPVKLTRLDDWRRRGVDGEMTVRRWVEPVWTPSAVARLDDLQAQWLGRPYDARFEPGNDALYCSELVREAYRIAAGVTLTPLRPVSSYDVDDPALRTAMIARWGAVPSELMVVAPVDLADAPGMAEVAHWRPNDGTQ